MSSLCVSPTSISISSLPYLTHRSGSSSIVHHPTLYSYGSSKTSLVVVLLLNPPIIPTTTRIRRRITTRLLWAPPNHSTIVDSCQGWDFVQYNNSNNNNNKGWRSFLLVGFGTSILIFLAIIAHSSISTRGVSVRLSTPLHALHDILSPSGTVKSVETETTANDAMFRDAKDSEKYLESISDEEVMNSEKRYFEKQAGKIGRIFVPTALDSTQQEALLILRRLKIIEEDIKADELCTRREYARWLVKANSLLERNPKHRILSPAAVLGSISAAFDDIPVEDPDFEAIQSLAEAGIVRSKLAGISVGSYVDDTDYDRGIFFFPERFLARQDLIDWKAQLEYEAVLGMNEKISGSSLGFMDVREINTNASPKLFVDMMAGDRSILRKVFGQGKRFQPNKPSTKAQAAVALTSGRMAEAINAEITRLDAENISRKREMEVIKFELLGNGDIKILWDRKLEGEKIRASEVGRVYFQAMHNLEQEKNSQEKALAEYTKQRAAMDCQRQLLLSLKEEVDEMSKMLTVEKVKYVDEQRIVKDMISGSQSKFEKAHDTKSVLEAEIESLRILRSWIEDEAMKSQARVKVLEEVGRRWKWEDRA